MKRKLLWALGQVDLAYLLIINSIRIANLMNQHTPTGRSNGRRQEKVAGTKSHADGTSLDALYLVAKNDKLIN